MSFMRLFSTGSYIHVITNKNACITQLLRRSIITQVLISHQPIEHGSFFISFSLQNQILIALPLISTEPRIVHLPQIIQHGTERLHHFFGCSYCLASRLTHSVQQDKPLVTLVCCDILSRNGKMLGVLCMLRLFGKSASWIHEWVVSLVSGQRGRICQAWLKFCVICDSWLKIRTITKTKINHLSLKLS